MGTQLPSPKREHTHQFRPIFIVAKRLDDQDDTWYGGRPMPRRHCVRSVSSPSPKSGGNTSPIFGLYLLCPNGWMDEDGTWWVLVQAILWYMGIQLPSSKTDRAPNFHPILLCQTAGCIKIPLGMEVGLSPGDCVTWEPSPPPQKGAEPRSFRRTCIVAATAQDLPFHKSFPP